MTPQAEQTGRNPLAARRSLILSKLKMVVRVNANREHSVSSHRGKTSLLSRVALPVP